MRILIREQNTWALERGSRQGRFGMINSTPQQHPDTRQDRLSLEPLLVAVAGNDVLAEERCPVTAGALS